MRPFIKPDPEKSKWNKKSENFGEFTVQPFERGWGTTIGNALRRVLLSSIEGGAITAVRIEGVLHEFTTISGVKEDITTIILNLKGINIVCHSDEPRVVTIKARGPATITAKDIQHDDSIKIINKDAHIATLNEEGKLDMKLIVQKGRGYVPAEQNKTDDPLFVPIDAIYSPVLKVNYKVEETRVGEATDFEKVTLEIWTNGAVGPREVLQKATGLLNQHIQLVEESAGREGGDAAKSAAAAAPKKGKADSAALKALLSQKVTDQENLSKRVLASLDTMNIKTIKDLVTKTEADLREGKNFGEKALGEINELLESLNLTLGMKV